MRLPPPSRPLDFKNLIGLAFSDPYLSLLRSKTSESRLLTNLLHQPQAHRVVLAACSDYFRAMFTDPMRERSQNDIQLPGNSFLLSPGMLGIQPPLLVNTGVSAAGVKFLLDYVYTSKLALSLANVQDVLSAASHLQVLISRILRRVRAIVSEDLPHIRYNSQWDVMAIRIWALKTMT